MNRITATTIGKLIQAHYEGDEEKFKSYAKFIEQAYKDDNNERGARIIHKSIDGSYKNEHSVVLDKVETSDNWKEDNTQWDWYDTFCLVCIMATLAIPVVLIISKLVN